MIQNKNGPPGWMHPPNKGAPRGPSPGTGGQTINVMTGYFDRNGRATPEQKAKVMKAKVKRMMLKGQHEAIVLTLTDLSMLSGSKNEARELLTVGLRSSGQRQNKSNASDMKTESLTYGAYYHIYNRGNNSCDLFREEENYKHFLDLYDRYMNPVAETYAWVLMLYPVKYF